MVNQSRKLLTFEQNVSPSSSQFDRDRNCVVERRKARKRRDDSAGPFNRMEVGQS